MSVENWRALEVSRGQRIQPAYNRLIKKAESADKVTFGPGLRVRLLPDGGYFITADNQGVKVSFPWKVGAMNPDNTVFIREGTVGTNLPWIDEERRLGIPDEDGSYPFVPVTPKREGATYIAVGVNLWNTPSNIADLSTEFDVTYEHLRISSIDELPAGMGSGGVLEDDDGWAWYPLVRIDWMNERMDSVFQIVRHNLGHFVARDDEGLARHFFPPL